MASNIDNLNFKVILDDKDFNDKVQKDIALAEKLNTQLSQLLQAKVNLNKISATEAASAKRASDILTKQAIDQEKISQAKAKTAEAEEKIATQAAKTTKEQERAKAATSQTAVNVQRLATEQQRTTAATQNAAAATSRAALAQKKLADYSSRVTTHIKTQSRLINELKGYALGYLSISGASKLLSSLVRVTGEFELQRTTLAAMLGDLKEAENIMSSIKGLAIQSPFQFKELATYAKQLSAFAVPAEELYETTKMLADVSAGLGVGMDRIVLAYGQVRSAAFLRGQEVRQFTEAGIPILDMLAKQFEELEGQAVSTGEVFDRISARLVPFEMVAKAFKDMTSEGGRFYNMQEIQAETLKGKISNLKDAYEIMLNEIGEGQTEKLKGAVDWVRKLMVNYEDTGRSLIELIAVYGTYKASLAAISILHTSAARNLVAFKNGVTGLILKLSSNPYAVLAAGVTTLGYALYKASTEQTAYEKSLSITNKAVERFNKNVKTETNLAKYLFDRLEKLTVGTTEYNEVKSQILRDYGQYLSEVDKEKIAIGELTGIYDKLTESIRQAAKEKAIQEAGEDLTKQFTAEYDRIFSQFNTTLKALGIEGKDIRQALADYVRGDIGLEDLPADAQKVIDDVKARINAAALTAGGQFGNGIEFAGFDLELLRNQLAEAEDIVEEGRIRIAEDMDILYGPMPKKGGLIEDLKGWRKTVQDTLTDLGLDESHSFGLWAKESTQSQEYVADMVKRYKELGDEIKYVSSFDKEQADRLTKNKVAIEAVASALNLNIKELAASKGETAESKQEKEIKRLVDALRTLQSQYEKLKLLGASDESIKTLFEGLYPDLLKEKGEKFVTDLKYLDRAKALLEELAKTDPEAAKKLLVDIGQDEFTLLVKKLETQQKEYKQTAKDAGEYFNLLREWSSEDFNLSGEGITLDVSKIASDLNEKVKEIELKATKAREIFSNIDLDSEEDIAKVKEIFVKEFGADAWEEFWNAYYIDGFDAIQRLTDKQKEYEKKLAQEKVNDLAEKYVKESYFTQNVEISDLGDKTFFQIRRIKKQLQELMAEEPLKVPVEVEDELRVKGVDVANLREVDLKEVFDALAEAGQPIDDSTKSVLYLIQQIQQAGLSTVKFGETVKKVFKGDIEELTEEEGKLLSNMIQDYLGEMQGLFESIGEFAEKMGNDKLQGAMNGIAQSMEILGNVADRLAKGDWVGAIISGVTSLANVVMEALAAQLELNKAIAETRNEMRLLASENAIMQGVESAFGTDEYKKFTNAYDEVVKAHKQATEDIQKQNLKMWAGSKDNWGMAGAAGSAAGGAALGAAIGSIIPGIGTAVGAGIGALAGMIVGMVGDIATQANDYAKSLQEMADEIGADLINEKTGAFNSEALKSIKDTYKDLDSEYQEMLDKLITNAEIYENAITEMANYMTDVFGQCADDMADAFIESFKESGEAALDYGDIVSNVATSIAKSVLKSAIIQNVWDDAKAQEAAERLASGDMAGAMQTIENAMIAAQDLAPNFQSLLESLQPYFDMGSEASSDLTSGIKGITEDTANLLASYLNAIRADVSFSKGLWVRMDANLLKIADMLTNSPSLMEYQAQIAANTYNTSIATERILAEIRSVVTTDGGDSAIRIHS